MTASLLRAVAIAATVSAVAILPIGAATAATAVTAATAAGTATVTVTGAEITALDPDAETVLELSGSGFQSVRNGFGGIYVLFGWVSDPSGGSWAPSAGGITGETYRYALDDEQNPAGYQAFLAFPGSSTESSASGVIAEDGTWTAQLTVPTAQFTSYDRMQNPTPVDCLAEQCGIVTIGAHGVINANNETFTPVSFTGGVGAAAAPTTAEPTTAEPTPPAESDATPAVSAPAGDAAGGMPLSVLLGLIAGGLLLLGIVLFAAGAGGYLAVKSILLGVSPAARERHEAAQAAKAAAVRRRAEVRAARGEAKHRTRLARIEAESTRAADARASAGAASAQPSRAATSRGALARFFAPERPAAAGGAPVDDSVAEDRA